MPGNYVIDLRHWLDERGALAQTQGRAQRLAEFTAAVVAHESNFDRDRDLPGPLCFKCRRRVARPVNTDMTEDDVIRWHCVTCGTQGQVSNWQNTFWDLSCAAPET